MRVGKSDIVEQEYTMINRIPKINSEKDIGVIIDDQLSFSEHLAEKINKANKIVGIIPQLESPPGYITVFSPDRRFS